MFVFFTLCDFPPKVNRSRRMFGDWLDAGVAGALSYAQERAAAATRAASATSALALQDWLQPYIDTAGDALFVAAALACFWKLPRGVAVVVTGMLGVGGVPGMLWGLHCAAVAARWAAAFPLATVFALWLLAVLQTAVGQRLAVLVGLDVNGDGSVDWLDLCVLLWRGARRCVGFGSREPAPVAAAAATGDAGGTAAAVAALQGDVRRLEAKIDALLAAHPAR